MPRNRGAWMKRSEGYSLIEIILVIALVGILAAVLIPLFRLGVEGYVDTETRLDLSGEARQAANRMVREIRNIQKEANNTPNITIAEASRVDFVDVLDNAISFRLSVAGNEVERSGDILADMVSALQFRYFDGSNTELSPPLSAADRDNVRRIMVVLTLQDKGETLTVTGQAFLRELTGL